MIIDICASCYHSFAKGEVPKATPERLTRVNGTCRDLFRQQGGQWEARGAAEEQALGQSLILLYPVHAGWTLRSHLCQLSSFQAWTKDKLWLLEHFWALYLKPPSFNVQGKHNRKSIFLLPWSVCPFPYSVEAAWPDPETPLHVSETSPLKAPVASPLNQSSASPWWGKGTYFLLTGITSLERCVL